MGVGLRQAAEQLGIHHATLLKAHRAGRVPRNEDGTFEVEACRESLKLNTNLTQQANSRSGASKRSGNRKRVQAVPAASREPQVDPVQGDEGEVDEKDGGPQPDSYSEACRREKWASVKEREFRIRKLDGELVELVAVNAYVAGMIIQARDTLLRLPAELRDRMAQETDPVECERILSTQVDHVLRKLSEYRRAA